VIATLASFKGLMDGDCANVNDQDQRLLNLRPERKCENSFPDFERKVTEP